MNLLSLLWKSLWKSKLLQPYASYSEHIYTFSLAQCKTWPTAHSSNKPGITGPRNKAKPVFRAHVILWASVCLKSLQSMKDPWTCCQCVTSGISTLPSSTCMVSVEWKVDGSGSSLHPEFLHRTFFESCVNTDIKIRGAVFRPLTEIFLTALLKKKIQGKNTSQILLDNISKERHVNVIPTYSLCRAQNLKMA